MIFWINLLSNKCRRNSISRFLWRWKSMDKRDSFSSKLRWTNVWKRENIIPFLVNWNGQGCIHRAWRWLPISRHNVGLLLWNILSFIKKIIQNNVTQNHLWWESIDSCFANTIEYHFQQTDSECHYSAYL